MAEHKLANFIEIDGEKYIFPKRCYEGMIIESTTLKTEQEVIDFYGGVHWQPIIDFTYGIDPESAEVAGTYHEEELPNITGAIDYHIYSVNASGAFANGGGVYRRGADGDDSGSKGSRKTFDASRSSRAYKNGGRVMPRAMRVYKWLCTDEGSL